MTIVPIETEEELRTTMGWYAGWRKISPPADWFGVGWWVPGVAACFAYVTDGPRVYLEDVIANPEADAHERDVALDALEAHVAQIARGLGKPYLVGSSDNVSMIRRARKLGWLVGAAKNLLIRKVL